MYNYLLTCLLTYLLTYLLTCLLTYLLTCLPTYLLTYLHAYLLTYLLITHWSRVLEKLTGSQLFKKFPAFYGIRRTTFTDQSLS